MAKESLLDILDQFGFELVSDLKQSLIDKGVVMGGGQESELAGSIKFKTEILGLDYVFTLSMNDYWKFVDKGRKSGKMPPLKPIEEWITAKGIPVKKAGKITKRKSKRLTNRRVRKAFTEVSFEKRRRSLAYVIARNISKRGTIKRFQYKGTNFYQPVIDKKIKELKKRVANYTRKEIVIDISK